MRWISLVPLALAATCRAANEDGPVTDLIKPQEQAPEGCKSDVDGRFQVTVKSLGSADGNDISKRSSSCGSDKTLVMTLVGGVLTDAKNRTGYIASNRQFQFDGPPQSGAIYTGGFSLCGNGSLALGSSTVLYKCLSGDFSNLYDQHWAEQCSPVNMIAMDCEGGSDQGPSDGITVGTSMKATTLVTMLSDGQPQVVQTSVPIAMCQIGDGQVQVHTTPCDEAPHATQTSSQLPPVSQISDGQPQVPTSVSPLPPMSVSDTSVPETPAPETSASNTYVPEPSDIETYPSESSSGPYVPEPSSEAPDTYVPQPSPAITSAPVVSSSAAPEATAPESRPPAKQSSSPQPQAPKATPTGSTLTAGAIKSLPGTAVAVVVAAIGAIVGLC
ncbi:hypothetical protein CDD83_7105 [Cordyceps sp. RAO-2017]|nr:hypothetical protein CDD83_7105 [Cordyceps sp. RAO-2017]